MCYKPIRIINNAEYIHSTYSKICHTVPCGHCYECNAAKTLAWQVRCIEERNNAVCTYFYTLTCSNDNITTYGLDDNGKPYFVFNKSDIQKWLKRFRKYLHGVKLKYIITSELGENFHRPHYHVLLYFHEAISAKDVHDAILATWKLGFIKAGDNRGLITDNRGVMYVVKYMHKTDHYYNGFAYHLGRKVLYHWYKKLLTEIPEAIKYRPKDGKLHYELIDQIKLKPYESIWNNYYQSAVRDYNQHCAFHVQSTNFGIPQDWSKYKDNTCILMTKSGPKRVSTPLYYRRQLYYDRLPNFKDGQKTIYRLNTEGVIKFAEEFSQRLKEATKESKEALEYYKTDVTDDLMSEVHLQKSDIDQYIKTHAIDNVAKRMAVYRLIYKDTIWHGKKSTVPPLQDWYDYPEKMYLRHLSHLRGNGSELICNSDLRDNLQYYLSQTYNMMFGHEVINELVTLMYNYRHITRKEYCQQKEKELDERRKAKHNLYKL